MSEKKEIPNGWTLVKLGDVCSFEYGKALKAANREKGGKFPVLGSNGCVGFHDTYLVNGPGVVIGRKGAAGEISFVGKNFWPIDTTYFLKLNKELSLLYFYFLLKRLRLNQFEKSTAIPGLNRNDAYDQTIPLPPLPEQHRIVAKIEELFSSLDKGIESLKTAQQQLKVYRQAVLRWAFEGKLTNKNVVEGELPEAWRKVNLGEVCEKIQIGPFGTQLHKEDYITGGIPLINPMHFKDGTIQSDASYSISKKKGDSLPNYILNEGDIIMGRRGEMGRYALVGRKEAGWFCGTGSLYIRPKSKVANSFFLLHCLREQMAKKYLEENAAGTTMANLNSKIVNNIPICVPPIEEQQAIVAQIESRLSVCDNIEEDIEHSLKQSEVLRQSILKKAFAGKLVPQDPNDEPAGVLLERIRAEREKNKPEKLLNRKVRRGVGTRGKEHVIPAKAGIQKDTGFRVKPGMTNRRDPMAS